MECLIKIYYGRIKLQDTISKQSHRYKRSWIVDADGHLGRLASKVAMILRGKYKPSYTPHVDWDNVIVINSEKSTLQVTKWTRRLTSVTLVTQEVKEL
jgi:large subunit ribosomal protein L13